MTAREAKQQHGKRLSIVEILAGTLAAVSSAVAASALGVAGTVIGAALGSVVGTVGTVVYTNSLARTRDRLKGQRERWLSRTDAGPPTPVKPGVARVAAATRGAGATARVSVDPTARVSVDPTARVSVDPTVPVSVDPTARVSGVAPVGSAGIDATAPARRFTSHDPTGATGDGAAPRSTAGAVYGNRRRRRWPVLVAASVAAFALALGVITAAELGYGAPLANLFGAHVGGGTTIGDWTSGGGTGTTPAPTAHPSSTATVGRSPSPAPSASSVTDLPSQAPASGTPSIAPDAGATSASQSPQSSTTGAP